MTERQLILHVGLHKTGTSSIQRSCGRNRRRLREWGIEYPTLQNARGGRGFNHSVLVRSLFDRQPERYDANIVAELDVAEINSQYRRRLDEALGSDARTLVISGEGISKLNASELTDLRGYLEAAGWPLRVVAYVRRPTSMLASMYAQGVNRGGRTPRLANTALRDRIENLRSVFPGVEIFQFDQVCAEFGGPVQHFLRLAGVDDISTVEIFHSNEGFSNQATRLIAQINAQFPVIVDGGRNPLRQADDVAPLRKIPGEKFFYNRGELEAIQEELKSLNDWLMGALGPEYCDSSEATQPLECTWTDQQLHMVESALPELPSHFMGPVLDYFAEAGLSVTQRQSLEKILQRLTIRS